MTGAGNRASPSEEKPVKQFAIGNIVIVFLLAASVGQGADPVPPLLRPTMSTEYAKQRDRVLPSTGEQSYRKIPWRTSVLQGVVDAQKNGKPVMIVLMNGHPLGCT